MSETAILNASVAWDDTIHDSIGPDFGWERLRRSQLATIKPAGGRPWSRLVGNGGHTTTFSWLNRSRECVEKLKQWAEQYEDGFFTVIDHDGGGRHYVGRFVGDMPVSNPGNDRYSIQGWAFEELPGCPMVEYPGNWDKWSVSLAPFNDFGDQATAISGAAWAQTPLQSTMENLAPVAGDWAQHEYRGYGVRLWMAKGPAYGVVQLYLDGALIDTVDLYDPADLGPQIVSTQAEIPLGIHRVKVVLTATQNVAATGTGAVWCKLDVMR